jgi:hypothetical protein
MDDFDSHPVAGIDYPETLQEFDDWFATEQACLEYLQKIRWPNGFICPACKGHKAWQMKTGLFRCTLLVSVKHLFLLEPFSREPESHLDSGFRQFGTLQVKNLAGVPLV